MALIQFTGLVSGLDTGALIDGLVALERGTINLLAARKVDFESQDVSLSLLSGSLAGVKTSAQALALSIDFDQKTVASSDTSVLTVSTDSTAQAGSYNVVVTTLAQAKSLQSSTQTSSTVEVGTGTLTLTIGSASTNVTIDTTNNTLTGLKEAINESGAAVTASIVNVGTTASPDYRLIVKSKDTGTANAVSITSALNGGNANDPFAAGGIVVQAAADAAFTVDGLSVTRSSNTVSDVIGGLTFTLLKAGDTSNITVADDTGSITNKIQSFVDAYNAVIQIANAHYTLDPTTNQQGVLASDPVLRGVVSQLRAEVSAISRGGTSYSYLSNIGVRFEDDGTLALDSSVLSKALSDNSDGVQKLFLSIDAGIGKRIPDLIDDFIDSIDGVITARQDGIGASIKSIDDKIASEEERIALFELRLVNEFAALESLIAQLNTQSEFLAQQFASLPSIGGN